MHVSCQTPWDPMVPLSMPGSSVHGTFHARILPLVALSSPGIIPTQGLNPCLSLQHWQADSLSPSQTLCNPMDYTVHGILQARIMELVAFPFFRGSSQPRGRTRISCIAGGFFTSWATREAHFTLALFKSPFSLSSVPWVLFHQGNWCSQKGTSKDPLPTSQLPMHQYFLPIYCSNTLPAYHRYILCAPI